MAVCYGLVMLIELRRFNKNKLQEISFGAKGDDSVGKAGGEKYHQGKEKVIANLCMEHYLHNGSSH